MASSRRRPQVILALDFGSSAIRAGVVTGTGRIRSVDRRPIRFFTPVGAPATAREFDADEGWQALVRAARSALRAAGLPRADVAAIAVTSQRLGLVLVDRGGTPVYAGPNIDMRAAFQGAAIDENAGELIWERTGHGPGMLLGWARMQWLKEESPAAFDRAAFALSVADWVVHRLTGELRAESALAVESGLAMLDTGAPAAAIAARLGLDGIVLPPPIAAGEVAGTLAGPAARQLGLKAGTPVIAAGPDTQAGLLGLGCGAPGSTGVVAGWSAAIQQVTAEPILDRSHALWTGRHVLAGRWVVEGNAGEMGGAYRWLVGLLAPGEAVEREMTRLERAMARRSAGTVRVAAHLGPASSDMKGVTLRLGGLLFPVPLSFEPPDVVAIARAALESFAFAIRANLEKIASLTGSVPAETAIGGGMIRSRTFREILASVLAGRVGVELSGEASLLGAAMLAADAVQIGPGLETALHRQRRNLRTADPGTIDAAVYEDLYGEWRQQAERLSAFPL